jgi:membrane protease YdiL (CAAX protease family)
MVTAIGLTVGMVLVLSVVFLRSSLTHRGSVAVLPAVFVQLVMEAIIVVIVLAALPRVSGFSLGELGFRALQPWQAGVAVLGAIAMVIVVEGGASLIEALLHQKHEQSVIELFKHIRQPLTLWFFSIFAIVLAPIAEETIFRVFIFNFGMRYGGFWLGAILSGICFGLAHMDAFVFLPLALGGVILCYVYYRTGNAFASMISHGIFNSLTILALLLAPQLAK